MLGSKSHIGIGSKRKPRKRARDSYKLWSEARKSNNKLLEKLSEDTNADGLLKKTLRDIELGRMTTLVRPEDVDLETCYCQCDFQ